MFPHLRPEGAQKRCRNVLGTTTAPGADPYRALDYGRELLVALGDLRITPDEEEHLRRIRHAHALTDGRLRAHHAHALAFYLTAAHWDGDVDETEVSAIEKVVMCLRQLGWAPGEPPQQATYGTPA